MRSFFAFILLLAGLASCTYAKKDCVAGYAPYAAVPISSASASVPLNLFTFPVVSPTCKNFKLSTDTTTVTNVKVSFVSVTGSVLVQNIGSSNGTIIFTPMLSQQQGVASAKQTIAGGGAWAMVPMGAVPRIETGETVTFLVSATGPGSLFVVGGGLSSVEFARINQPLSSSNVTDARMKYEKEMCRINMQLDALRQQFGMNENN